MCTRNGSLAHVQLQMIDNLERQLGILTALNALSLGLQVGGFPVVEDQCKRGDLNLGILA